MGYAPGLACDVRVVRYFRKPQQDTQLRTNRIPLRGLAQLWNSTFNTKRSKMHALER
jgi:hypothetical protein